jgi:UDP-N-acetyl-D-glucosamine dehydrogenase
VGVTYKPGIADLRESPALRLLELLIEEGARAAYHDPLVPVLEASGLRSVPLQPGLADHDLVVLASAAPGLDLDRLVSTARAVLDLRGAARAATRDVVRA